MKNNNKGFSLVELIIAFAIAAIAGLSVYGMMSVSGNIFRRTSNDVGLQYEQQIVINQIRDYVLESSSSIYYDESTKALYTYKQDKVTTPSGVKNNYDISKLTFVPAGTELEAGVTTEVGLMYANTKSFVSDTAPTPDEYMNDPDLKELGEVFGENIKDVEYDLSEVKDNKLTFKITFIEEEKEFTSVQVVALRNRIVESKDLNKVVSTVIKNTVDSYIQYIGIKRLDGDDVMTTGRTDPKVIGTVNGQSVKVKYKAMVYTKVASERDYRVNWTLEGAIHDEAGNEIISAIPSTIAAVEFDNSNVATLTVNKAPEDTEVNGIKQYEYLYLTASSIDEPDKSCTIRINVDNNGNYPLPSEKRVVASEGKHGSILSCDQSGSNVLNSNGLRVYTLIPRIGYERIYEGTDSSVVEDAKALELIGYWEIECFDEDGKPTRLPVGAESGIQSGIDPATGKLSLTDEANGMTIKIAFRVKERDRNGDEVWSNIVTLTPTDIQPYSTGTSLEIVCNDYANRAGKVNPAVNWSGVSNLKTQMRYFWKIVPYEDNDENVSKFGDLPNTKFDNVKISGEGVNKVDGNLSNQYSGFTSVNSTGTDGWYYTQISQRIINVDIDEYLNWKNTYKFKVLMFGVSLKQQSIGSSNFSIDNNVSKIYDRQGEHSLDSTIVPVEFVVTIPKVTLQITAIDDFNRSKQNYNDTFKPKALSDSTYYLFKCSNYYEEEMRAYQIGWNGIEFEKVGSGYYPDLLFYDSDNYTYSSGNNYKDLWNARGEFSTQHKGYAFYINTMKHKYWSGGDYTGYGQHNPYKVDLRLKCETHGYTITSEDVYTYSIEYTD